jgi:hypothetical protein
MDGGVQEEGSLFAPAFFLEGLTLVTLIGTGILIATFAFLFFAEKSAKK